MAFDTAGRNPHHKKLPRDARHIISRLRRPGLVPYRRASVLHAQVAALDYAVNRRDRRRMPLPGDSDSIAPGQRVRLGVEVRDLLNKLHESKNVREQQALVREIRHAILRRIIIHVKRSKAIQGSLKRTRAGFSWLLFLGIGTYRKARALRSPRESRPAAVRTVGHREREVRVRARRPVMARPGRTLPAGERTGPRRPVRSRAKA